MSKPQMERFTAHLPPQLKRKIEQEAEKKGIGQSELARNIFEAHFASKEDNK